MTDTTLLNDVSPASAAPDMTAAAVPPTASSSSVQTSRIVSGGLWGVGGQVVTMAASLVATPFVIRLLGPEKMGVLALVNVLISYGTMADVGMGPASTKFGADAFVRGDTREEGAVIWTSLIVLLVPTVLTAAAMLLLARPVADHVLHVPDAIRPESILALRLAAIVLLVRSLGGVLNTPQMVRLRLDLVSAINNGGAALQILSVPVALWALQGGLGSAVGVVVGVGVGIAIAHAVVAVRLLPTLRRPRFVSALVPTLLRYGGSTSLFVLITLVLFNAEKFLVSTFGSAASLGYYSVAFQITRMLAVLPGALSQPLLPAFARLHSGPDADGVQRLYDRSLRWLLLVNVPGSIVLIFLAGPILTRWAGPDYGVHGAVPLAVLAVGCIANGMAYVPILLLQGVGRIDLMARYFALLLAPYLVTVAVMTYLWGPVGAAWAWTARSCVECALMLYACRNAVGIVPSNMRACGAVLLPSMTMAVLLLLAPESLRHSLVGLAGTAAVASACYALITWVTVLSRDERDWLVHHAGAFVTRATGAAA